jgi:hypothetical protein
MEITLDNWLISRKNNKKSLLAFVLSASLAVVASLVTGTALAQTVLWDHTNVKYGTATRQFLNIYRANTSDPAPVYFYSHANGATAYNFLQEQADTIVAEGYTLVSWESVALIQTDSQLLTAWSDAQLAFDWVRANAATYNLNPDHIVIGGRSRGSVASWPLAHSGHAAIKGIYMYNALPEPAWQSPGVWTPVDNVNPNSPPTYLAYGPLPEDVSDIHNPVNAYPVVARYGELGIGDKMTLTDGMDASGLTNPMHYFPDLVATLEPPPPPGC